MSPSRIAERARTACAIASAKYGSPYRRGVARDQLAVMAVDVRQGAEAIELHLVQPVGMIEAAGMRSRRMGRSAVGLEGRQRSEYRTRPNPRAAMRSGQLAEMDPPSEAQRRTLRMAAFATEREFGGELRVLGSVLNVVDFGSRITCRPRRECAVWTLDGVRHPAVVVDARPNGKRATAGVDNFACALGGRRLGTYANPSC